MARTGSPAACLTEGPANAQPSQWWTTRRPRCHAALLGALAVLAVGATPAAAAPCSRAAARSAVIRYHLGNAGSVPDPVTQVLCGPFLGAGSTAMVASLTTPGCGGTIGWVVFRRSGGSWRIAMQRNNGALLTAVGSRIKETMYVLRPQDAHCFPTGGTRSRTWHWTGSRLVVTAWKYTPPAPPKNPPAFVGGAGETHCTVDALSAMCSYATGQQGSSPFWTATLTADGNVATCNATLEEQQSCKDAPTPINAPILPSGTHVLIGPFDCEVHSDSIGCTVADGRGFVVTKTAATPVAP
jgi:hypothetical protein